MSTIGQRIKTFRKLKGISQLDLELAIGASAGGLSRIENGKVKPSRETIQKISNALELNSIQSSYLDGTLSKPASNEEITSIKSTIKDYFQQKDTLAYIIDDRYRLIYASNSFVKILGLTYDQAEKLYGTSLITLLLDTQYPIREHLDEKKIEELLYFQLGIFNQEMGFMKDDEYYVEAIKSIRGDKKAHEIYQKIKENNELFSTAKGRTVSFKFGPLEAELEYSVEPIQQNPRFRLVEYQLNSKLLNLISKLIF